MKISAVLAFTAVLAMTVPTLAQNTPLVSGKVVKIDESAGKITIDHQKIPNLDMPAMTMVFHATDPSVLKGAKAGESIKFTADRANGQLVVTSIQKTK